MYKNGMYEVTLGQALDLLIRAANQRDYDNVIYFATKIKEESKDWKKVAPVLPTTNATAKPCDGCELEYANRANVICDLCLRNTGNKMDDNFKPRTASPVA